DPGSQRKRLMRRGEFVLIVDRAAGGGFAVKAGAVPGRDADLAQARFGRRRDPNSGRRHEQAASRKRKKTAPARAPGETAPRSLATFAAALMVLKYNRKRRGKKAISRARSRFTRRNDCASLTAI